MNSLRRRSVKGFTLVEMVVAIVLTAIVVGFATMFLTAPVDTYYAQSRRAELVESSDAIKRSLTDDLRKALPNSVRISVVGTRAIVELLVVEQVAFYRGDLTVSDPLRELKGGSVDTDFATLGSLVPGAAAPFTQILPATSHLAVSNRGIAGANAYLLANVITAASQIEISNGGAPNEEDHIKLTPGTNFPTPPTSSRIFLVSGPVTYICNSAANARTVRRYEKYLINQNIPVSEASAQLNGAGVVNTIIARDVTACQLRCSAGSTSPCQGGLVADMIVSRAVNAGNDFIKVFAQLPVENTP